MKSLATLWKPKGRKGIELFRARLHRYRYAKHMHECFTIGLNDGGQGRFWCRGTEHEARPGGLNLINPNEVHTGQSEDRGWFYRDIYIEVRTWRKYLQMLGFRDGLAEFTAPVAEGRRTWQSFHAVFTAMDREASQLTCDTLFLEALATLAPSLSAPLPEAHPATAREPRAVANARELLEAHRDEDLTLRQLAQSVDLHPHYLVRAFKKAYGLPPHGYQRHLRLLEGKRRLANGQPIAQVAHDLGFFDQSHFHRHFKQTFGVSPGAYRKVNSVQEPPPPTA
ncbi:AraC family transcriptional regulator [Sulfidibacter corallicola]|uniref:AraC family transcriptional regulator n=1 Tax=Sulfidibacter corallicola TaxID=2818388 RepID=A0A8A4THS8_SULCO|nr:AraC family transcriptional regulator [Sulfidibacter corallicola]QTD49057.1 AraC family transcriptional regulator [Sulfidibacter corallicola]